MQRSAHPMKLPAMLTRATARCSPEAGAQVHVVGTAAAAVEAGVAAVQHPVGSTTKIGFVDSSEVARLLPQTDSNLKEPVLVETAHAAAKKQLRKAQQQLKAKKQPRKGQSWRKSCSIASNLSEAPHLVDSTRQSSSGLLALP